MSKLTKPSTSSPVHQRRAHRPNRQEMPAGGEVDAVSGLADLPQGFADEPAHVIGNRRRQNLRAQDQNGGSSNSRSWILPFAMLMVVALGGAYVLISHHERAALDQIRLEMLKEEEVLARAYEQKYAEMEEEKKKLELEMKKSLVQDAAHEREQADHARKLADTLQTQIVHLSKYKHKMHESIKLMSKTALLEKFGPGPHRVGIVIQFDPDFPKLTATDKDTGTIVIELAPADQLPHVVYWFLEQVSRELYDGCSFHRNAGHVIQGGATPNFLSPPNPRLEQRFVDAGFHSVLFQEYSAQFPHKKYTLGLAGRPGGPDFYISMQDNSELHGPGGQTNYEDPTEADPCFAKVVKGFEVVDRMHQSPVQPGGYDAMVHNVAIRSMKILTKDIMDLEIGGNVAESDKATAQQGNRGDTGQEQDGR